VIKEPEAWGSCALAGGTHGPLYCAVLPLALAATVQLRAVASFILMCHQTIEFWEQWYRGGGVECGRGGGGGGGGGTA